MNVDVPINILKKYALKCIKNGKHIEDITKIHIQHRYSIPHDENDYCISEYNKTYDMAVEINKKLEDYKNSFLLIHNNFPLVKTYSQYIKKLKSLTSIEIKNKLSNDMMCLICSNVMIEPYVIQCGHTLCESCCNKVSKCPFCRNEKIFSNVNISLKNIIDQEIVYCGKCDWTGKLEEMSDHSISH
ncbi:hypothetical protein Catovirus_1_214 [Catovirus CTV1]|uniref:RING-type domain-containing protein n=1 Tax=Catovirus CTV1 TaxID=1977631 RepID=A0A1V0S8Y7_9VIRU|nr:hypothetical protein Catovirus_1_214 [Catovirus CTV1]